jgi:hypothetical protein
MEKAPYRVLGQLEAFQLSYAFELNNIEDWF